MAGNKQNTRTVGDLVNTIMMIATITVTLASITITSNISANESNQKKPNDSV